MTTALQDYYDRLEECSLGFWLNGGGAAKKREALLFEALGHGPCFVRLFREFRLSAFNNATKPARPGGQS